MDPLQRHSLVEKAEVEGFIGDGGCSGCGYVLVKVRLFNIKVVLC